MKCTPVILISTWGENIVYLEEHKSMMWIINQSLVEDIEGKAERTVKSLGGLPAIEG